MPKSKRKATLIGPSPPPFGGARVSFELFKRYTIESRPGIDFHHADIPQRRNRDKNPPGPVRPWATAWALLRAIPHIFSSDTIVVFASRNGMWSYGLLVVMVAKAFGKKCFVRFFGGRPFAAVKNRPVYRTLASNILALADGIAVQTHVGAREFPRRLAGKVTVIYGYREQPPTRPASVPSDTFKFAYVGAVTRDKGIDVLLTSFAMLLSEFSDERMELHLFGIADSDRARTLATLPSVNYRGQVEHEHLVTELQTFDALVFPSLLQSEGHPGALVEGLFAGLPMVATDLPGPREVIEDQQSGLIVPPGDPDALYKAMKTILINKEIRDVIKSGSIERSKRFNAKNNIEHLCQLFLL